MNPKLLTILFGCILASYNVFGCGSAVPYIIGQCGANTAGDYNPGGSKVCTVDERSSCDESLTFEFVNPDIYGEPGFYPYLRHKWILDGTVVKSTQAMTSTLQLDPDNMSNGVHNLEVFVQMICPNPPGCTRTYKYSFTINKITEVPDLEVVARSSASDIYENIGYGIDYAALNTGDEICQTRTNVKLWWSLDSSIDSNDILERTFTNVLIQNGPGSINWISNQLVYAPFLSELGLPGNISSWNVYLLAEVDYTNAINEFQYESNNVYDDLVFTLKQIGSRPAGGSPIVKSISSREDEIVEIRTMDGNVIWNCNSNSNLDLSILAKNQLYVFSFLHDNEITKEKIVIE